MVLDWVHRKYNSSMIITYLKVTEELQFVVEMPTDSYLSLGFGKGMYKVDMMTWHGLGEDSKTVDYWSMSKDTPDADPEEFQNLDTTFELNEDGSRVTFTTKRKLDTGDADLDYLIRLDEETDMVWAMCTYSGEWIEHNRYGQFITTFDATYGNVPLPGEDDVSGKISITGTSIEDLSCLERSWDEFSLDSCYDPAT